MACVRARKPQTSWPKASTGPAQTQLIAGTKAAEINLHERLDKAGQKSGRKRARARSNAAESVHKSGSNNRCKTRSLARILEEPEIAGTRTACVRARKPQKSGLSSACGRFSSRGIEEDFSEAFHKGKISANPNSTGPAHSRLKACTNACVHACVRAAVTVRASVRASVRA